jgi:hypothetical protein
MLNLTSPGLDHDYGVIVHMYSNGGLEISLDFGTTCRDVVVTSFTLPNVSFSFVEVRKENEICDVGCCRGECESHT